MKKFLILTVFLLVLILCFKLVSKETSHAEQKTKRPGAVISLEVGKYPTIFHPSKIGINLGQQASWGNQQFSNNLLMNPGFEGKVERVIVIVSQVGENSFSDEAGWGSPDDYWNEAEFDIRSGESAGRRGVIKKSLQSGENGLPQYFSHDPLPLMHENDVIVLTKTARSRSIPHWWFNNGELVQPDPYVNRTESWGNQSLKLTPTKRSTAEIRFFADTLADLTGNTLRFDRPWRFTFWARSEAPGGELEISFQRDRSEKFLLRETFFLTTNWQEYTVEFQGDDKEQEGFLRLAVTAIKPDNPVWLDDLYLGPSQEEQRPFRKEVVDTLKLLKPSYLREFAPLGNTWENHLAPAYQRKSWVYRLTGGKPLSIFNYSLEEFLTLCEEVGANPWLIVPPTFSDYEIKQFGAYLSKNAHRGRFSDVIVEFGAESWNWLYRPLAIPYHDQYGKVADRAFGILEKALPKRTNVRFIVNGEYSLPPNALRYINQTTLAEGLAVAPYFLHTLNGGTPDKEALLNLFNGEAALLGNISEQLFAKNKGLAVSEINLHTTKGDARAYERNRIVSGAASGAALAKKILKAMSVGADPILVNNLGQYHTAAWDVDDFVNLWGIVRDFGPSPLLRPTGLAVFMLNQVIGGNLFPVIPKDNTPQELENLTLAAFKTPSGWSGAFVSGHDSPLEVEILFPDDGHPLPDTLITLQSNSPFDTNEEGEKVKAHSVKAEFQGRTAKLTVPPWGFVVLVPQN